MRLPDWTGQYKANEVSEPYAHLAGCDCPTGPGSIERVQRASYKHRSKRKVVMQLEQIERLIRDEYAFFLQERNGWSLTARPQDLELVAHALRVLLHARATPDFLSDYLALVDCQNVDGGWSPFS